MIKVIRQCAQGELLVIPVEAIPETAIKEERQDGKVVVGHSETGHHHVVVRDRVDLYQDPEDPLLAWLEVHDVDELPQIAELIHERSFDTHEALGLTPGKYKIRRRREYTPEGWRRVED